MGRVHAQRYKLRSADSFIVHDETSLNDDLNTVDGHSAEILKPLADCNAVKDENFDNEVDPAAVEKCHNTLPLHNEGVDVDGGHSGVDVNMPLLDDTSSIETARARFLDFIINNFIGSHVIEATKSETDSTSQRVDAKLSKRKRQDVQYEGDPQFVLPTMYVANMYETLVNEVNPRLPSLDGWGEETIGVGIEAAGGLYRKLAKKFPKKGLCAFKRQELTTSLETRSKFPEIVKQKKRVRFMVVNGLDIIEKPIVANIDDAEWFKRLTGRSDVAVSPRDYKFFAPRHKHRRYGSATMSPQIPCLQPPSHIGKGLHVPPSSLAKFCDECGAAFLRETSKFCSECGVKRLGI